MGWATSLPLEDRDMKRPKLDEFWWALAASAVLMSCLFCSCKVSSGSATGPYAEYLSREKIVTEFDWRIMKVQMNALRSGLGVTFADFLDEKGRFRAYYLFDEAPGGRPPVQQVQQIAELIYDMSMSVLGLQFPRFLTRGGTDLVIEFRHAGETVGISEGGEFRFEESREKRPGESDGETRAGPAKPSRGQEEP